MDGNEVLEFSRENDSRNAYCPFCASHLARPDGRKGPRAPAKVIIRRMGGIAAVGAFWLAVFISSLTAIVALYSALRGTGLVGGLGVMFAGAGAVVGLCSMLTLGRIPERYVATRGTRCLAAGFLIALPGWWFVLRVNKKEMKKV